MLRFWFPDSAYYNTFYFDIVYGDNDRVAASGNIYWEGEPQVFEYDASWLLENCNGAGKYTIRLWNGKRIAYQKSFKIK